MLAKAEGHKGGQKKNGRAGETAEPVKALAAEPEDLSLVPGTHMVERES